MATGIITAAGEGSRLGLGIHKLEAGLLGMPVVAYSLLAFEEALSIERLILVVPAGRLADWHPARLEDMGVRKVAKTIAGGETRQDSVRLALEASAGVSGTVVVHDGARPLVTASMIDSVSKVPAGFDGVVTAVAVTDTIKEVEDGVVVGTPDRGALVAVQTPQAFGIEILRRAHDAAKAQGFSGTDDASLVERIGGRIMVVPGSRDNIKVTYPEDIARARDIIISRSGR